MLEDEIGNTQLAEIKVPLNGEISGTRIIIQYTSDGEHFDKMKSADVIYFDNPGLKAVIDVKYSSQVVEARVEISSLNPVTVAIEFPPNDLSVLNLQNLSVTDQSSTFSSASFIKLENVGDNNYIIQWYNKNNLQHQISFKFYQNDMVMYSNAVTINKE